MRNNSIKLNMRYILGHLIIIFGDLEYFFCCSTKINREAFSVMKLEYVKTPWPSVHCTSRNVYFTTVEFNKTSVLAIIIVQFLEEQI